jgi:hypothetical protein
MLLRLVIAPFCCNVRRSQLFNILTFTLSNSPFPLSFTIGAHDRSYRFFPVHSQGPFGTALGAVLRGVVPNGVKKQLWCKSGRKSRSLTWFGSGARKTRLPLFPTFALEGGGTGGRRDSGGGQLGGWLSARCRTGRRRPVTS